MNQKYIINENIKVKKITLIDDEGKNLGEINTADALKIAEEKNLDLVLISQNNDKFIAKILDYGKFVYDTSKKNKDNKKHQTIIKNKEIKVKPLIGDHDLKVRTKKAIEWLKSGDRIRFVVLTYGRIGTKQDLVIDVYNRFIESIKDYCEIQVPLKKVSAIQQEAILIPKK